MSRRGWRLAVIGLVIVLAVAIGLSVVDLGRPPAPTGPSASGGSASPGPSTAAAPSSGSGSPTSPATTPGTTLSGERRISWSQLPLPDLIPAPRQGHSWTVDPDNGLAYLFGGLGTTDTTDTTATGSVLGDFWAYDLGADRWEPVLVNGKGPAARWGHAAAWIDGVGLVIIGGRGAAGGALDDSWRFDPDSSSWQELEVKGVLMPARSESCAIVDRAGALWMIDGRGTAGEALRDVWRYRPSVAEWDLVDLGTPAPERFGHICWLGPDGRGHLFGGQTDTVVGDSWGIDLGAGGSWTRLEVEPGFEARRDASVAVHADRAVIVGGVAADGSLLGSVGITSQSGDEIVRVGTLGPSLPGRARAALIDDPAAERMLLFGGLTASGVSNELWQAALD